MSDYIDTLRQLNYELVKELGLFKRRAGLSFTQRHTLFHIKNNDSLSIQELAAILHVDQSTMSRNIKKLIDEKLVEVFTDEHDKRRKAIFLTEKGEKNLDEITVSINQMLEQAIDLLEPEEVELIIKSMQKYSEVLNSSRTK